MPRLIKQDVVTLTFLLVGKATGEVDEWLQVWLSRSASRCAGARFVINVHYHVQVLGKAFGVHAQVADAVDFDAGGETSEGADEGREKGFEVPLV